MLEHYAAELVIGRKIETVFEMSACVMRLRFNMAESFNLIASLSACRSDHINKNRKWDLCYAIVATQLAESRTLD